ncbi:hypothetical protein K432DRAFT_124849 [Lepidopterella palustris CBS 459.81]|uniref:Uncharacterized protein n=1 Tax=Lepidopterella palustris CBS 459.81 TaxID=1314670 RepID=A0A8E2EIF4_9PEZI|nr:hypothetical protein K432DRAFT_124849 [Lepidopterella palustris CBS 459.81]
MLERTRNLLLLYFGQVVLVEALFINATRVVFVSAFYPKEIPVSDVGDHLRGYIFKSVPSAISFIPKISLELQKMRPVRTISFNPVPISKRQRYAR